MHARVDFLVANETIRSHSTEEDGHILLEATHVESKKILRKGQTYVEEKQVTSTFNVFVFDPDCLNI